ncbi:hypothetical protein ABPG74_007765 [Tetrahymena malaccensis]
MEHFNLFQQSQIQDDPNQWLNSIIVFPSQINQNSILVEDVEFKTFFIPQSILNQVGEKSIKFGLAKNKVVIIVFGSTGSGKTTAINFLIGKKMIVKRVPVISTIPGYGEINSEDQLVICTEEDDEEFKIGFKKQSQTVFLKVQQMANCDFFICDTPGFKDSRGFEEELSNSICLSNFVKQCRSICPILTINYHDLQAARGELFKDILISFSQFIEIESMDKILYFFTHVPEDKDIEHVKTQIILIYMSLCNNLTSQLQKLLYSILDSFENRAFILNPIKDNPEKYLNLFKGQNENSQFINDPQNTFKINLSEDTVTKLKIYSEDLFCFVKTCTQKGFMIEKLIDILNQYTQIKNYTNIEYLEKKYNQYTDRVLKYAELTKKIAFKNLNFSKNVQSEISETYLNQIKTCLDQTKKIDQFRDPHFQKYKFSYSQVVDEISQIIKELQDQIKVIYQELEDKMIKKFNDQIEQVDLKQIKFNLIKIEQLSKLSTEFQSFYSDAKDYLNKNLLILFQKNKCSLTYLSDILFKTYLNEKIEFIATSCQIFQEIDSKLDQNLLGYEKQSLFLIYKQDIIKILSQQSQKLNQNVKEILQKLNSNVTPDLIKFQEIISKNQLFEIKVLIEIKANKYFSENVEFYEQYYNCMKDNIEQLSKAIMEYLTKNSQKKKYIKEFKDAFDTLEIIRKIKEDIYSVSDIDINYIKLIQSIKNKIMMIQTKMKYEIKLLKETNKIHQNRLNKLKKYNQFLVDVTWIDDQLNTGCVKQTKQSIKKSIQKYFNVCIESCGEELKQNQSFDKLNSLLICISKLKEIKDLIDDFEKNYEKCVKNISEQIIQNINPIQLQIQQIVNNQDIPNQKQIQEIDQYLKYKAKIEKIKNSCICIKITQANQGQSIVQEIIGKDVFERVEIEISNDFEVYFKKKFDEFQMLFEEQTFDQIKRFILQDIQERGLSYWQNYIVIIDFCQKECHEIMDIIGVEPFKRAIRNITNAFYILQNSYLDIQNDQINQDCNYLVEVSSKYAILQTFIETFSKLECLFFMKLFVTQNSKCIVRQSSQNLQRAIKLNYFSEIKTQIEQLKQLTDDYSKKELQICIQQLEYSQSQIIDKINIQVQLRYNQLYLDESFIQQLKYLQEIQNIIKNNKFKELDSIFSQYIKQKIELIFKNLKNLQFSEIHLQFNLTIDLINQLQSQFLSLFSPDFFKEKFQNETIKKQIKDQIKNLYQIYDKQKVFKLNKKLNQIIQQSSNDDPFKETYQEQLIQNFYNVKEYVVQELNKVQLETKNISKQQIKQISIKLNQLKQLCVKLSNRCEYLYLKYEASYRDLQKQSKDLINKIELLQNEVQKIQKTVIFFSNSYENFEEQEQNLDLLKQQNILQYRQVIETIELSIKNSLIGLVTSYSAMEKQIREQKIKQIVCHFLKYDKHFGNNFKDEIQQNKELNILLKKKLFVYEEELQNIQLEAQNLVSLIIVNINQQVQNEQIYKNINLLYDFQDKLQQIEGLDISAQLKSIKRHLKDNIEVFAWNIIFQNKIVDREIIVYKVSQQFPNLEGKMQHIISQLITKSINGLF